METLIFCSLLGFVWKTEVELSVTSRQQQEEDLYLLILHL